jgi:hypothetical protein
MPKDENGAPLPGVYFLKAFGGKGKEAPHRPFGFVDVVVITADKPHEAEYAKLWCDMPVAVAASQTFAALDRVRIETEETVYGGQLRSRLSAVYPA